jgi:hypothetical protein
MNNVEMYNEWGRCKHDPHHFISEYVKINNIFRGKVDFILTPEQVMLLASCEKLNSVLVKKDRQVGASTFLLAYALWMMTFHNDKRILFVSPTQDMANGLMEKFRFFYTNLPDWIKCTLMTDNRRECIFHNGSAIQCTSDKSGSAGCGTALHMLVFDEAALFDNAEDLYLGSLQCLVQNAKFVVCSSTCDVEGWFETMFEREDTKFARMYMCKTKDMRNIPYSPPYMPVDEGVREIWAILVDLGYDPVKIVNYEPKKKLVFVSKGKETTIDLSWAFRK